MTYKRGDIILAFFPYSNLKTIKKRPALVVQSDSLASDLTNAQIIVAQITSQMKRSGYPCRVTLLKGKPESKDTNLLADSVVMADKIAAIPLSDIDKAIGRISDMNPVDDALRAVFDI